MISYEWVQKQDRQPTEVSESFYWSPRGKLVRIANNKDIDSLIEKGFRLATEKELERFKPGDYFPAYDQGPIQKAMVNPKQAVSLGDILEVFVL